MDVEKIIQDLNRRFAAPLPEFYKRRVIFCCDENREAAVRRILRAYASWRYSIKCKP